MHEYYRSLALSLYKAGLVRWLFLAAAINVIIAILISAAVFPVLLDIVKELLLGVIIFINLAVIGASPTLLHLSLIHI